MMIDSIIGFIMIQFGLIMLGVIVTKLTMKMTIITAIIMDTIVQKFILERTINKVISMKPVIILGLNLTQANGMPMVILNIIGIPIGIFGSITILMKNHLIVGRMVML